MSIQIGGDKADISFNINNIYFNKPNENSHNIVFKLTLFVLDFNSAYFKMKLKKLDLIVNQTAILE